MKDKIKLSKHRVWARAEFLGFDKPTVRSRLGVTIQALYYRFKHGWTLPDAEFLARVLKTKVTELTLED